MVVIFQFDPNDLQSLLADAEEFSHLMDENEESGTNMTPWGSRNTHDAIMYLGLLIRRDLVLLGFLEPDP